MDQQNQMPQCNNRTPFGGIHTISQAQFDTWTENWYRQVAATETPIACFINANGRMARKIYFNDDTVQNLLSSVGIENIHARFAIVDYYDCYSIANNTFTIILYATDSEGKRCSAYHIGKPQYHYNIELTEAEIQMLEDADYIRDTLAKKWINGWKAIANETKPVFPPQLFLTNYGFISGYNYLTSDFMYALYPPGTEIINYDIIILLAVHQQIVHDLHDRQLMRPTFGLVLAGVEITKQGIHKNDQQVNSYYDLSLPCPPNQ